ncbi:MAG: hypothetical protein K2X43_01400 [Hyphomonadaceae bacterium]|nr:hypothetical protein [Hyphomonadaceae bacterium]
MFIQEFSARPLSAAQSRKRGWLQSPKAAAMWVPEWVQSCADRCAAAAMHECLSRLSDAERAVRGFSRATLAHNLICDQAGMPRPAIKPAAQP